MYFIKSMNLVLSGTILVTLLGVVDTAHSRDRSDNKELKERPSVDLTKACVHANHVYSIGATIKRDRTTYQCCPPNDQIKAAYWDPKSSINKACE